MATTETNVVTCYNTEETTGPTELARRIAELGEWFHNIDLKGTLTALCLLSCKNAAHGRFCAGLLSVRDGHPEK